MTSNDYRQSNPRPPKREPRHPSEQETLTAAPPFVAAVASPEHSLELAGQGRIDWGNLPKSSPRMIIVYGRSKNGKSFWTEFVSECALNAGRKPMLCDVDRDNGTLSGRFGEGTTLRPKAASSAYFQRFMEELPVLMIEQNRDAILDLGFGRSYDLREMVARTSYDLGLFDYGIRPILVVPLSASVDDLKPVQELLKVFQPAEILAVLNQGALADDVLFDAEFEALWKHPEAAFLTSRNPRLMFMPRMPGGSRYHNARRPFALAGVSDPGNPLSHFERHAARRFVQDFSKACEDFADLLP